jgi:hypothetical protein
VVFITHHCENSALRAALEALQSQQDICNEVLALPVFAEEM